jgi:hypothetical protein
MNEPTYFRRGGVYEDGEYEELTINVERIVYCISMHDFI